MSEKNYDATSLLALPSIKEGSVEELGLKTWSRPFLIEQIRERGTDVAVVRGASAINEESGTAEKVTIPYYLPEGVVRLDRLGNRALTDFNVLRSIVGPKRVDGFITQLNPYDLRMMARNKAAVAGELFTPNGAYDRNFVMIDPQLDAGIISDKVSEIPGSVVVAKPNHGRLSRGVVVGSKELVNKALGEIDQPYIVEEKLDFSAPLPSIKGVDEEQQRQLEFANQQGVNKEVRLYYFGKGTWDAVARVAAPGETDFRDDTWLYIDMDSVPQELFEKSTRVIDGIAKKIGTEDVHLALDWVFASTESNPEPRWQIMEMNTAEPQLIQLNEHYEIGSRQHMKLAAQIARLAVNK